MKGQGGFALLAVTVALAVLSLILAAALVTARNGVHDTVAQVEDLNLDAALDAGTVTAARDLAGPTPPAASTFELGDVVVTTTVRPEAARIDINVSDTALLSALMQVSGISRSRADRIADEIADWRDADSIPKPLGAERGDYIAAGRRQLPANAPFDAVADLSALLHGDDDLAACLQPDVTVFTHARLASLPGASERVRKAMSLAEPAAKSAPTSDPGIGQHGDVYAVTLVARARTTGAARAREVILRVGGSVEHAYWILAQSEPPPDAASAARACARFAARAQ
jgi:general secretion pathway protein K